MKVILTCGKWFPILFDKALGKVAKQNGIAPQVRVLKR